MKLYPILEFFKDIHYDSTCVLSFFSVGPITTIAVSNDKKKVITGSEDRKVIVWNRE